MRNVTLLAFLLFITTSLHAKQKFGLDLGVGVKGGLNVNRMTGKGWTQAYHTDPLVGFFAHLNKRHFGIQIEALWNTNTVVSDSSFRRLYQQYYNNVIDSLEEGRFRFSMISIPILLNIKLTQKVWLQLGPQFMGNVSMTDKNHLLKSGVRIIESKNMTMVGGLWYQFGGEAPLIRVNAGLRFVSGINNMNHIYESSVWKSQMIQLHLGLSY